MRRDILALAIVAAMLYAAAVHAQAPAAAPAPARGGAAVEEGAARIRRGLRDPAAVARGKAVYDVNCALCHGEDARGGDNGPNLIRGEVVMNDQNGETIGPVLQTGRLAEGMPKFDFTAAQICRYRGVPPQLPRGRLRHFAEPSGHASWWATRRPARRTSNPSARSCHSATGDLKGIGAKNHGRPNAATALADAGGGGGRGGGQADPDDGYRDAGVGAESGGAAGAHRRFHR